MTLVDAVFGTEAVLGRTVNASEMKSLETIVSRGLTDEQTWEEIAKNLGFTTVLLVKTAIAYRIRVGGAVNGDYEKTVTVLRDDVEMRVRYRNG